MLTKEQRECTIRIVNQLTKSKENFKNNFGFEIDELNESQIDYELLCKLSTFCGHTPQYLTDGDVVLERVRLLKDNRYCTQEEYSYGIVCFLDIVGFKRKVLDESNYFMIRNLFNNFTRETINNNVNKGGLTHPFEISVGSDSVFITCEKDKLDFAIFGFFLGLITKLRTYVVKELGTDIRACICQGKYYHGSYNNQVFFGPAIVESYTMAESDTEMSFKYNDITYTDKPVMISISSELVEEYLFDFNETLLLKLDGVDYYALNPYMFDFVYNNQWSLFKAIKEGKEDNDNYKRDYWIKYAEENEKHLNSFNTCSEKIRKKYQIYKDMLKEFKDSLNS